MARKQDQIPLFGERDEFLKDKLQALPILKEDYNEIKNWNLGKNDIEVFAKFGLEVHRRLLEGNSVDDLKKSYSLSPFLNSKMPDFLKERNDKFEKTFQLFANFENKKKEYIQNIAFFFKDKFGDLREHINENSNPRKYEKAFKFFFVGNFFKPIKIEQIGGERNIQEGKLAELLFYSRIRQEELKSLDNVKKRLGEEQIKKAFQKIETILSAKEIKQD
jgi:hypothetical protein